MCSVAMSEMSHIFFPFFKKLKQQLLSDVITNCGFFCIFSFFPPRGRKPGSGRKNGGAGSKGKDKKLSGTESEQEVGIDLHSEASSCVEFQICSGYVVKSLIILFLALEPG